MKTTALERGRSKNPTKTAAKEKTGRRRRYALDNKRGKGDSKTTKAELQNEYAAGMIQETAAELKETKPESRSRSQAKAQGSSGGVGKRIQRLSPSFSPRTSSLRLPQ